MNAVSGESSPGKKLLVISDSHGHVSTLTIVFNWARELIPPKGTICACAYLGDGFPDLHKAAEAAGFYSDWKLVRGNNDYGIQLPEAAIFNFVDHRFYMCHGHKHSLYSGHHVLLAAVKSNNADAVLFGHSHVPVYKVIDGISFINPGSVGQPRSKIGSTFAVIECPEGEPLNVEFFSLGENGQVKKVKIDN
ncbi:MAG: YfcE family phosphodiesterase [Treponema sp.]|nr:YfcE family phosphodiesterase [Treponema sp.]